jgi:hypothetical protein
MGRGGGTPQKREKSLLSGTKDIDDDLAKLIENPVSKKSWCDRLLTCGSLPSVCQHCYGWSLAPRLQCRLGEAVGIIAAQSLVNLELS